MAKLSRAASTVRAGSAGEWAVETKSASNCNTRLTGRYDTDLKWAVDVALALEMAGRPDEAAEVPDLGTPGPTLIRAVQDQLGLKLTSTKGPGDIVVIDHIERVPTDN